MWVWWFAAAVALIVVEVLSLDLVLVMFAGGAIAAGVAGGLGAGMWVQIVVFAVVATALLLSLRPWLLKHLRRRTTLVETNVDAHPGRTARTVTEVGPDGGRIKLVGEVWSARSSDGTVFPVGTTVTVIKIEGATAVVGAATEVPGDVPASPNS